MSVISLTSLSWLCSYLSGTLNSHIGKLTQINEFFLDDNELTGTIPSQIGKLLNATYISLANNYFGKVYIEPFYVLSTYSF